MTKHHLPFPTLFTLGALVVVTAALLIMSILFLASRPPPRLDPLTITACTPDSYQPPERNDDSEWLPGPDQTECDRPFADPGDTWPVTAPVPVAGQVCNSHSAGVAYTVRVDLVPVDRPELGSFPLVSEVPITYPPGCQAPYEIEWEMPSLLAGVDDGLGRWRAVGVARPIDVDRFVPFQWDSFASVELVHSD